MTEDNVVYLADKAHTCLVSGQLDEAKSLYTRLCHLDQNNEEVWLMLAAVNGELGVLDEALSCVNRAIELDGDYVEAYLARAHLLEKAGNDEDALTSALKAVEIDEEYPEAWLFLSGAGGKLKRYVEAEEWARKAVGLLPANVDALVNLGNAQYELGHYAAAEQSFRQILELQPNHFDARLGLAKSLSAQQRFEEALEYLGQVLEKIPGHSEACDCLALCYAGMGRQDDAVKQLQGILRQDNKYMPAYIHLAHILEQRGDLAEAIECLMDAKGKFTGELEILGKLASLYHERGMQEYCVRVCEEALEIEPDNFEARYFKVLALGDWARYEQALDELQALEAQSPDNMKLIATKAALLEHMGDYEKAHELVLTCCEADHVPSGAVHVYAQLCHRYDECDNAIRLMNEILEDPDLEIPRRRGLLFTLGKLHDRLGNYEAAFERISEANRLKPYRYDHERYVRTVDKLTDPAVTRLVGDDGPRVDIQHDVQPVFIVGMPRSGTSLVEQIIASHPHAFGGGERDEINSLAGKLPSIKGIGGEYPECLTRLTTELIEKFLRPYDEFTRGAPPGTRILTDKMPENFAHLLFIRMLFPQSPIIHCVRNPLDTCLSCYFQQFSGYHDYAYDLVDLGRHYSEYQRLMRYYRDVVKIPMLEVQYEDVVNDTETWVRKIIDYCGLEWDERCLRYYESDRIVRTASYSQVQEPIYTRSVNRWKHYEKYLQPLINALDS